MGNKNAEHGEKLGKQFFFSTIFSDSVCLKDNFGKLTVVHVTCNEIHSHHSMTYSCVARLHLFNNICETL